jgi:hypothetical protein
MAGLGPAIHVFAADRSARCECVDARHKAGHDELAGRGARIAELLVLRFTQMIHAIVMAGLVQHKAGHDGEAGPESSEWI